MRGRCVHNSGAGLGAPTRGAFYSIETNFNLTVDKQYFVLGLGIWETLLVALVQDDAGGPEWMPIGLFEFEVSSMPADWRFALYDGVAASGGGSLNRWVARWGYSELVVNDRHSDGLIERDPDELRTFYRELDKRTSAVDSLES